MSSIPLPAMGIRPPDKPADPIEQFARAQGVMSLIQQQKLQQQQLQQNELNLKDQKAQSDAMRDPEFKDLDGLPSLMIKHGASATAVLKMKNDIQDYTSKRATATKTQNENDAYKHDQVAGGIDAILEVPQAARADAIESFKNNPEMQRILDPVERQQFATQLDSLKQRAQAGEDITADLTHLKNQHQSEKEMIANGTAQADLNEKRQAQALTQAKIDAQNAWLKANPGKTAADFDVSQAAAKAGAEKKAEFEAGNAASASGAAVPGIPLETQEANDWLKKNPGKSLSDYQTFKTEQLAKFNYNLQANGAGTSGRTAQTGDAYLSTLPTTQAARVKAIAEGREPEPTGMAMRSPYAQRLMADVYAYDPGWSSQRAQIRKAFTTGKDADNIGALNTATVHLDALYEAAKALANGNFTPGNAAYQRVRELFGSSAPTTFDTIKTAVASEQANALKGSATDPEIAKTDAVIQRSASPQQLADNIEKGSMPVMFQKLNTYKERYEQQIPNDTAYSPVLPSAAAAFQKHGVGAAKTTSVPGPGNAKFHYAGKNGEIFSDDGKTWYDGKGAVIGGK